MCFESPLNLPYPHTPNDQIVSLPCAISMLWAVELYRLELSLIWRKRKEKKKKKRRKEKKGRELKSTLFIMTKHKVRIFGGKSLLQATK